MNLISIYFSSTNKPLSPENDSFGHRNTKNRKILWNIDESDTIWNRLKTKFQGKDLKYLQQKILSTHSS